MAKRFTDTDKWKKPKFSKLSMKMKLVWMYLLDNCDHAGIWDLNLDLLSFQIGEKVTDNDLVEAFSNKLIRISETKYFLPDFIEFQYGTLNHANRAHESVINRLKKEGAYKLLPRSFQGAKDKDKDKDKDKEEGSGEKPNSKDFDAIYQKYPRKEGKADGMKIMKREIKTPNDLRLLSLAIDRYRQSLENKKTDAKYIKHFGTFMSKWRDWLDDDAGTSDLNPSKPISITDILREEEERGVL